MTSHYVLESKNYCQLCLKLSRTTTVVKLKQLKFLLQDLILDIDINDNGSFLELITKLEMKGLLTRNTPGHDEGRMLCEMFDAVSMPNVANDICSVFTVDRGNDEFVSILLVYQSQPYPLYPG